MQLTSPGKLVVLLAALVGSFGGLASGRMSEAAAVGVIGSIVGYVVGNGTGALRGEPQAPLLAPKPKPATDDTDHEAAP